MVLQHRLTNWLQSTVPEARVLLISPFDKGRSIADIERAINESDLGINPANDGSVVIRLVIPALTEETRKELAKEVKKSVKMLKSLSVTSVVMLWMKLKSKKRKRNYRRSIENFGKDIQKQLMMLLIRLTA